jgi:hypothetical protein
MQCCLCVIGVQPAQDIDRIIIIPAVRANITPIAITLNDFSVNSIAALIIEATNNPATKQTGAMTQGISLINITIESIFYFNLRRQK